MRIKNITPGSTPKTFGFGRKLAISLAYNQIATIPDDFDIVAAARAHSDAGLLQIIEAPRSFIQERSAPQHILLNVLNPFSGSGDGAVLTLGSVVFELDSNSTFTAGRTPVTIGASNSACATNLKAAINANSVLAGLKIVATDIVAVSSSDYRIVLEVPSSIDLGSFTTSATGGSSQLTVAEVAALVPNAKEVVIRTVTATAATHVLVTGFTTITDVVLQVRTAAGLIKLVTAGVTWVGGSILVTGGTTAIASTDVLTFIVTGER